MSNEEMEAFLEEGSPAPLDVNSLVVLSAIAEKKMWKTHASPRKRGHSKKANMECVVHKLEDMGKCIFSESK